MRIPIIGGVAFIACLALAFGGRRGGGHRTLTDAERRRVQMLGYYDGVRGLPPAQNGDCYTAGYELGIEDREQLA